MDRHLNIYHCPIAANNGRKALVRLIVPVYNAEEYLEECLNSIRIQSFTDFAVLIVDDGSTDDSAEIADRLCRKDFRFQLVCTPNRGVSAARNLGIDSATEKYIGFVDADDCLHPRALEVLVKALAKHNAQVAVGKFVRGVTNPFLKLSPEDCGTGAPVEVFGYEEAMRQALYQKRIMNAPWGVLMERRLLDADCRFREHIRYEDLDAFYRFYEKAAAIVYLHEPVYFYRQVESSFMHRWSRDRLDALDVTDRMLSFMEERYPSLVPAARERRFSAHFNMFLTLLRYNVGDDESVRRCWKVICQQRRHELSDPNVRLKNKLGALLSYLGRKPFVVLSLLYRK